jgi:hypothetical protein
MQNNKTTLVLNYIKTFIFIYLYILFTFFKIMFFFVNYECNKNIFLPIVVRH